MGSELDEFSTRIDSSKQGSKVSLAEDHSSNDNESGTGKVILSIVWHRHTLGAALFFVDDSEIHVMFDISEDDSFTILRQLLVQVDPYTVLASSMQDERALNVVREYQTLVEEEDIREDFLIQMQNADFALDLSTRRLFSLKLPCIPEESNDTERQLIVRSIVPIEANPCMVRAAGGLLRYIEKNRLGLDIDARLDHIPILALRTFSLANMLRIDVNTLSALQIFNRDLHPSAFKCYGSGSKEGLSLYGVLNRCSSVIGAKLLRLWLMRPLTDHNELRARYAAVAFLSKPLNVDITASLHESLKFIKNVKVILTRMARSGARIGDWHALYKTIYHSIHIADLARSLPDDVPIFRLMASVAHASEDEESLHRIGSLISQVVDFAETERQKRFIVKFGIDDQLDKKKQLYTGLPDLLTAVAKSELADLPSHLAASCSVVYLQQLGFLLSFPRPDHMQNESDFQIPGMDFRFNSNEMVHYKTIRTRELDVRFGDALSDIIDSLIADRECSVMHRLQNSVLQRYAPLLIDVMSFAAELDCLVAFAIASREGNFKQPELTTENVIDIRNGRHVLQELCVPSFVPYDLISSACSSKVKLITGPNACGKSVYLKQAALCVYTAHIGCFVAADSLRVGPIDRLFTRVKTNECVSVALSTFAIDLNQVSVAVNNATGNSLVILDEFGKGSDSTDGMSLFAATLDHWLSMESDQCPHVLSCTHFTQLATTELLQRSPLLKCQTMEVVEELNSNGETDLVFLYRLKDGISAGSRALSIAAAAGVDHTLLRRARQVSVSLATGRPVPRRDGIEPEFYRKGCVYLVDKFLHLDFESQTRDAKVVEFLDTVARPLAVHFNIK